MPLGLEHFPMHTDTAVALHTDLKQFAALHRSAFEATGDRLFVVATTKTVGLHLESSDPKTRPVTATAPSFESRHAVMAWELLTTRVKAFVERGARLPTPLTEAPSGFVVVVPLNLAPPKRQERFRAGWVPYGCIPSADWASEFLTPAKLDAALGLLASAAPGHRLWAVEIHKGVHTKVEAVVRSTDVGTASHLLGALFGVNSANRRCVVEAFADTVDPDTLDTTGDSPALWAMAQALRSAREACKRWDPNCFSTTTLSLEAIADETIHTWVRARPLGWRAVWDLEAREDGFDVEAGLEAQAHLLAFVAELDTLPFFAYGTPIQASLTLIPGGDVLVRLQLGEDAGGLESPNGQELEPRVFLKAWEPVLAGLGAMEPAQHAWRIRTTRWGKGLCFGAANRAQALGAAQLLLGGFHRAPTLHRIPTLQEKGMTLDDIRKPADTAAA